MSRALKASILLAVGCGAAVVSACTTPSRGDLRPESRVETGTNFALEQPIHEVALHGGNVLHLRLRADRLIEIRRGEAPQLQHASIPDLPYVVANELKQNPLIRVGLSVDSAVRAEVFEATIAVLEKAQVPTVINAPLPGSSSWRHLRPSSHAMTVLIDDHARH